MIQIKVMSTQVKEVNEWLTSIQTDSKGNLRDTIEIIDIKFQSANPVETYDTYLIIYKIK